MHIRHEKLNFVYEKIKYYTLFYLVKCGDSGIVEMGGDCNGVGQAHSQYGKTFGETFSPGLRGHAPPTGNLGAVPVRVW